MPTIYVTEPDVIDSTAAGRQLGGSYQLIAGDTSFSGATKSGAEGLLIRSATVIDHTILESFPHLKHVVRVGVGLDAIDMPFCARHNIQVYNAPGANAEAVAEYVISVMLLSLRKLWQLNRQSVQQWDRFAFMGEGLAGRTIGIVGYGNVAKRLQTKLAAFEAMRFLVYDPYVPAATVRQAGAEPVGLDELLRACSIVSLHLPLTEQTYHLLDAVRLGLLPSGALLINAARGGIVDETALLAATRHTGLRYVADTVEGEPAVKPALCDNDHIIITPHIASLTTASDQAMLSTALDNFLQHRAVA